MIDKNRPKKSQNKKFVLFLDDGQAKLIRNRKKKEIISTERFINCVGKEVLLCGSNMYGSIILNEPIKLSRDLLKKHSKRHLLNDYSIDKFWPGETVFYGYSFRINKMFKNPAIFKHTNKFGVIEYLEFEEEIEKDTMRDLANLNREHDDKLKEAKEQKEQEAKEELKEEKEILQSNTCLDNYYNKLNSLKNFEFSGKYKEIATLFLSLYELYLEKANSKIYDKNGFVLKPAPDITANWIRVRIRNPKTIVVGSFRTITLSASRGIKAVIGKLRKKPMGNTVIQSVLFDKKRWSTKDAMSWIKEHKESLKTDNSDEFKEKKEGTKTEKAKWTTDYINILPNSSFAVIEPDYLAGKIENKKARHLPFKDEDGKIDLPHYRNALARVNQIKPITKSITTKELRSKAKIELEKHRKVLEENKKEEKNSQKKAENYIDNEYIPKDKDKGKPEEKWVWCKNCKKAFDYYKQLLNDASTVVCPNCGALVIFEEEK